MKKLVFALLLLSLVAVPAAVRADTLVDWTLSGNFTDGGSLSGTFTLDATTGAITAFNISTTLGSVLGAFNFTPTNTVASYLPPVAGFPEYTLDFSSGSSPIRDLELAIGALLATGGTDTVYTAVSGCPGNGPLGGCSDELQTTATLGVGGCVNDGSKSVRCLESGAVLTGVVEGNTGGGGNPGGGGTVPEPSTLVLSALGLAAFALKRACS